jgi:hypothetical protein
MASPVKTVQTQPLTLQKIAAATPVVTTAAVNTSTMLAASIYWDFASVDTTAAVAPTLLTVEAAQQLAGTAIWVPVQDWISTATTVVTDTCVVTATGFTSATSFAQNTWVFLQNVGTPASSEFHFIANKTGGGPYAYTTTDVPTAGLTVASSVAQRFKFDLDLSGITQIRFSIYNNRGTITRDVYCRIALTTLDSIT